MLQEFADPSIAKNPAADGNFRGDRRVGHQDGSHGLAGTVVVRGSEMSGYWALDRDGLVILVV